jgi:hypothetical protein
MSDETQSTRETGRGTLVQILAVAAGALLNIILRIITPNPPAHSVFQSGRVEPITGLFGSLFRFAQLLGNYYFQLIVLAVLSFLAVSRRNEKDAWIYGFLSGWGFFALIIFHWAR